MLCGWREGNGATAEEAEVRSKSQPHRKQLLLLHILAFSTAASYNACLKNIGYQICATSGQIVPLECKVQINFCFLQLCRASFLFSTVCYLPIAWQIVLDLLHEYYEYQFGKYCKISSQFVKTDCLCNSKLSFSRINILEASTMCSHLF